MEKVKVNDIEIAYIRSGKGTPLVLLHGYPLDHHSWDEVVPLLQDTFDLIIPDLRGFGLSTTINEPFAMDDFASDIAGLLDNLGIKKAVIAGHSMGGYVALAFTRLFPERVNGLGLISSQVLADPPDRKEGRYKSADDVTERGISGVVETMTSKFTTDPVLQALARKTMERQQPAAYVGALKAMAERTDATATLSAFTPPLIIIHGDADMLIPIDRAREMKAAAPHAHLYELKGIGHLPMMEAVRETSEALKSLI